jgi:vacuolar iron transporter family protein
MPTTPHVEKHFTASETVRDIVIGMSDGLTVPFALAAGLSGAVSSTHIIVTAGLAEIAAGSIAMGLGGYLAAKTDVEHYRSEQKREFREIETVPGQEAQEIAEVFQDYGLTKEQLAPLVDAIRETPTRWVDFMMRFELGLEPPNPKRARQSAFTIAAAYIVGGLVPLTPYIVLPSATFALRVSVVVTLLALFAFGYVKGRFTGLKPLRSGFQTLLIGGLSATAAFILAQLFK